MNRCFCTYFDHRYLARGLAMYESLKKQCPSSRLWVLCLSPECHDVLVQLRLPDLVPIALNDFEEGDLPLAGAKANRSIVEYYFTCTPSLPLYVLNTNPDVSLITYLDSDLYFFHGPECLFEEIGDASVAIIEHRFHPESRWMEQNGRFNVGWLTFRRDSEGLACLKWWREKCIEWCYDRIEADRFADQKYLDRWPELFKNMRVIRHKGANVANWNLANYRLGRRGAELYVDEQPLIFFHFHGIRRIAFGVVDPCAQWYGLRLSWLMEWSLFRPYLRQLARMNRRAAPLLASIAPVGGLERGRREMGGHSDASKSKETQGLRQLLSAYRGVLARRYLLSLAG